jgi:hypothetical protein
MNATIEIEGLRKRFGPVQALDEMTFTVQPGHVTGFVGPKIDGRFPPQADLGEAWRAGLTAFTLASAAPGR